MEEEHRKAIQSNFGSLVKTTDLDIMATALYEKGILTEHMIENYTDGNLTPIQRKRRLYSDIMRRGPRAFDTLLEVLEENGYWDLVRMLDPNSILNTASSRTRSQLNENKYVSLSNNKVKKKTKNEVPKSIPPPAGTTPTTVNNNMAEVPFHVIKSTKFIEDNEDNDIKLYRTRGRLRGVLLMFIYTQFNGIEAARAGADVDCNNLKYLFSEIGFNVLAYQDLTKEETKETLGSLRDVLVGVESVFVVVSSHGSERPRSSDTDIRCSDGGLLSLREIIAYFSNRRLPMLCDVPKVFIFQICRGNNDDYVWRSEVMAPRHLEIPHETDGTVLAPAADSASALVAEHSARSTHGQDKMSLYTNILVVQSTLPGFVSRRDPALGSWYIQVLCEKFAERAHDCHVDDLFIMVDQLLKKRFQTQTSSVDRWGFNRRLYLHPGLFE